MRRHSEEKKKKKENRIQQIKFGKERGKRQDNDGGQEKVNESRS